MRSFITLFLYLIVFPAGRLAAQCAQEATPLIRNYTYKDYNASPQNWGITQGKRGLLYVANNHGVLEYDGLSWRLRGLTGRTPCRSVSATPEGTLYVGGFGDMGYLKRDRRGNWQYTSLRDKIDPAYRQFDDVWSIYPTKDGVFFCTTAGIYHYKDGRMAIFRIPGSALALTFYARGRLFTSVPDRGLYELTNGQLVLIPNSLALSRTDVVAVMPYQANAFLVATRQDGVYVYDGFAQFVPWRTTAMDFCRQNKLNTALALNEGYALGSVRGGLLLLDRNGYPMQQLDRAKGLQNNAIQHLFQDEESNLWVATNNGIDYVAINSPFVFAGDRQGLPGVGYSTLFHNQTMYWATSEGLFYQPCQPTGTLPPRLVDNSQGITYAIQLVRNQLLMAHHTGPYQLIGNRAVPLSRHTGAWLFKPLRKHPDYLLCGTYSGLLLYKFINNRYQFQWVIKGFTESSRIIEEADDGALWIAHGYKGLYRLELNETLQEVKRVDRYGAAAGFPSDFFINVFRIDNELVFTAERGVYAFDQRTSRFRLHPVLNKLFGQNTHVRRLTESPNGTIWFSAGKTLGYLQKNVQGNYIIEQKAFSELNNSLVEGFEYFGFAGPGTTVMGTENGFIFYRPALRQTQTPPDFYALIRAVTTANGTRDSLLAVGSSEALIAGDSSVTTPRRIPYQANSLRFQLSSSSLRHVDQMQYAHFLEGFDKSWSGWSAATVKEYTNLPEGMYTFHVRARTVAGRESSEDTYLFTVEPPLYRSTLAYLLYALLVLAVGYYARVRLRRREIRLQQQTRQDHEKALRLREAEYSESVLKAEKEIIRLNNQRLSDELDFKNKELASSAMHIIQRQESNEKIREQLTAICARLQDKEIERQLNQVIKFTQTDNLLENSWDQFEQHFNRTHPNFLDRFTRQFPQLNHQEIKLAAYLRMDLSSKDIASLMNLSLRSVENSRYRIRKKMNLQQTDNLGEYILRF